MEGGIDLLQFRRRFATERACCEHLFRQRWLQRFVCPRCAQWECSESRVCRLYQGVGSQGLFGRVSPEYAFLGVDSIGMG